MHRAIVQHTAHKINLKRKLAKVVILYICICSYLLTLSGNIASNGRVKANNVFKGC
jgi:hypothetical protein